VKEVARIIQPDGKEKVIESTGQAFTLEELQAAVGGYIEHIPVMTRPEVAVYVDEDGHSKRLPVNVFGMERVGLVVPVLVGNVVLVTKED